MWRIDELIKIPSDRLRDGWWIAGNMMGGMSALSRYFNKDVVLAYKRNKHGEFLLVKGKLKYFYVKIFGANMTEGTYGIVFRYKDINKAIAMFTRGKNKKIDKEEFLLFKKKIMLENLKWQ